MARMHTPPPIKHASQRTLAVVWGILTIGLLLLIVFIAWKKETEQHTQLLMETAQELAITIDSLITNALQSIHAPSQLMKNNAHVCTKHSLRQLQRLIFNTPYLAGILISDKQQNIICGTFEPKKKNLIGSTDTLLFLGPLQINPLSKPSFVIEEPRGAYQVNLFILKEILERSLKTSSKFVKQVALYDSHQQQIRVFLTRKSTSDEWETHDPSKWLAMPSNAYIKHPLTHLDFLHIYLRPNLALLNKNRWLMVLLLTMLLLMISFPVYVYLRRLVNHYFSLEMALSNALKQSKFFPEYQPIIMKNASCCVGIELLLRLKDDDGQLIMPHVFIETIEKSGLIIPITLQIVKKAFIECRPLLKKNDPFYLSINLSAIHFSTDAFFDAFFELCETYHVLPRQIMFELTERELLNEKDNLLRKRLNNLRHAGFLLAVDDFGTGHASINYLQHFPFNYLKIDQQYIQSIGTGAVTETLTSAIIHMAKQLDLHIIAEGVETQEQYDYLLLNGVPLMQGWYFARSMPYDQLTDFIENHTG